MKRRKPVFNRFIYNSKLNKRVIKAIIQSEIKKFAEKTPDFEYREVDEDSLWIKVGKEYDEGYWYIATITDIENGCIIDGNIIFDPDKKMKKAVKFWYDTLNVSTEIFIELIAELSCFILPFIMLFFSKEDNNEEPEIEKTKEEKLNIFMKENLECTKITERAMKKYLKQQVKKEEENGR